MCVTTVSIRKLAGMAFILFGSIKTRNFVLPIINCEKYHFLATHLNEHGICFYSIHFMR